MDLYDEVGTPAPERRLPDGGVTGDDVARWLTAAPGYGLRVVGPPIPEAARWFALITVLAHNSARHMRAPARAAQAPAHEALMCRTL